MKSKMNYDDICKKLGMDPSIRFVHITTRGTIGFTAGKPEEIRLLLQRVQAAGLKPSAALIRAALR